MSITTKDVEHIAKLAKLSLSEDEKKSYAKQLGDILEYVEKLDELDTESVKPLSHVMDIANAFREDKPGQSLDQKDALSNAPNSDGEFFKVPKVI